MGLLVIAVAGSLLWLALQGAHWDEFLASLRSADLWYVAAVVVLGTCNSMLRAIRWRVLLAAERPVRVLDTYWATMAGYLGNLVLPARSGEAIRLLGVRHAAHISMPFAVATMVTERLVDACALAFVGSAFLSALPGMPTALIRAGTWGAVVSAGAVSSLLILAGWHDFLRAQLRRVPVSSVRLVRLEHGLERFLLGLKALRNPKRAVVFLGCTVVIWFGDAVGAAILAKALSLPLSLLQGFVLIAALGLSSAIPSTPGYVGVYQYVAVVVLAPLGISRSQALAYILMLQGLGAVCIAGWGGIGLWKLGLSANFFGHPRTDY